MPSAARAYTAKKLMFPRGFCPGNVTGNTEAAVLVLWRQQRAQGSQRLPPENCKTASLDGQSEDGLLGQLPSNLEWHSCCEKENNLLTFE